METKQYGWNEAEIQLFQVMLKGLDFAVINEPQKEDVQVHLNKDSETYVTLEPNYLNWDRVCVQQYRYGGYEDLGWFPRKHILQAMQYMVGLEY